MTIAAGFLGSLSLVYAIFTAVSSFRGNKHIDPTFDVVVFGAVGVMLLAKAFGAL